MRQDICVFYGMYLPDKYLSKMLVDIGVGRDTDDYVDDMTHLEEILEKTDKLIQFEQCCANDMYCIGKRVASRNDDGIGTFEGSLDIVFSESAKKGVQKRLKRLCDKLKIPYKEPKMRLISNLW